jgi:hypothetical protein
VFSDASGDYFQNQWRRSLKVIGCESAVPIVDSKLATPVTSTDELPHAHSTDAEHRLGGKAGTP